ncbi:Intraflagellar transport protein 81 [Phlyctochytrium planicorne]|nr:Intraflagellar transport protein 81 [Phlyctochytrium planicorne]
MRGPKEYVPQPDLKLVVERLAQPPFSRNYSVIQLHDDVPIHVLLQLITDVAAFIDEQSPAPNSNSMGLGSVPSITGGASHGLPSSNQPSIHRVDIRNEDPEATSWRISELLRVLKYRGASDLIVLRQRLQGDERMLFLDILTFLLKDATTHKKRAYLANYLEVVEIPPEFMHDDGILDLSEQVSILQEQFKEVHKYVDGLLQNGNANAAANLKKEIQMMEEEKQQVTNKISKIKKKVQEIPNHESWLEAAKALRLEQQEEISISDRIREQKNAVLLAEKKYSMAQTELRDVRNTVSSAGPDALFAKMEEDCKMNKYLATENLPKAIEDAKQNIRDLNKVLNEPPLMESDFLRLDAEIKELSDVTAKLAEKRLIKNNSGDDKLALFRQQATIIARKKEGTAQRLAIVTEQVTKLKEELEKKEDQLKSAAGSKVLRGEEFKRYVSELRGKSNIYKRKKAELSELTGEFGILQRTDEILASRVKAMESTLTELEKRSGVLGFHEAKENLEKVIVVRSAKVSEKKAEVDEAKGKTLTEISDIIQTLMTTINDKKALLAPVIQELRVLRSNAAEVEAEYMEKKRIFDATMVGIESETTHILNEVKGFQQDIVNDQSRYHYLNCMILNAEISQERVLQEMKAYIGGDDVIELQQKARGFKTYRDLYNRKIVEQENLGKNLREQQKDIKAKFDTSIKQMSLYADVKKLLDLKVQQNKKVLTGGNSGDLGFEGKMTQDRLVL